MPFRLLSAAAGVLSLIFTASVATGDLVAYPGPSQKVPATFFGMHVHRAAAGTPWPPVAFSEWRLWDAGVSWPELEPRPGKWNFELLDAYTRIAVEHHVHILLTLGLTPNWASARPDEPSAYRNGNAAEPRQIGDWEEYIRVVATRYRGRIQEYEIWNEPNAKATFTGKVEAMSQLSRAAYRVLKSVDPNITVVSPSATMQQGVGWLDDFLRYGGCDSVDVIGYHFYVTPRPPETLLTLIPAVRSVLRRHSCDKPLWNTESGWADPKRFSSDEEAAAYLMRSYLLNWFFGVQRFYWYAWDNHNWSTLDLTARSGGAMTGAGAAYGVVRHWMLGAVLQGCDRNATGLWICRIKRENATSTVLWSENGMQSFALPAAWHAQTIVNWSGDTSRPGAHLRIDAAPVLVTSSPRYNSR